MLQAWNFISKDVGFLFFNNIAAENEMADKFVIIHINL